MQINALSQAVAVAMASLFASSVQAGVQQSGPDFVVNSLGGERDGMCGISTGGCTLADAIDAANGNPDASMISISGELQSPTIVLTNAIPTSKGPAGLPEILSPVTIQGGGTLELSRTGTCTLDENAEQTEFRLISNSSELTLNGLTLAGGCADGTPGNSAGGAIISDGELNLKDSEFKYNQSVADGGALAIVGGNATVDRSLFFSNTSHGSGGALVVTPADPSAATISNSTITANTALITGGGVAIFSGGVTLRHVTMVRNQAPDAPHLLTSAGETTTVDQSVFQLEAQSQQAACVGPVVVSMSQSTRPCGTSDLVTRGELNLGLLMDNGGPTRTHLLGPGSTAVDAGQTECVTGSDQRGFARAVDADGDGLSQCDLGALEIDNFPVLAGFDSLSPTENETLDVNLTANDQEQTGDDVGILVINSVNGNAANVSRPIVLAQGGTATIFSNGQLLFDPGASFNGLDDGESASIELSYRVTDGYAESSALVAIEVQGENDAPVADPSFFTTDDSTPINGALRVRDPDNEPFTTSLVTVPTDGIVSISGASFNFDPNGDFADVGAGDFRDVQFSFSASDGDATSDPAVVTIRVTGSNDAPQASDDNFSVGTGESISISAMNGLLANDADIDGDALVVTSTGSFVPGGAGGTLTINADGSFDYDAPAATGTANFEYFISDGEFMDSATLTINIVDAVNLAVSKDNGEDVVATGDQVVYQIVATNIGNLPATDARLTDILNDDLTNVTWTCTGMGNATCETSDGSGDIDILVDLPVGGSVEVEMAATVTDGSGPTIGNTAMIEAAAGTTELMLDDNIATDVDILDTIFAHGFEGE